MGGREEGAKVKAGPPGLAPLRGGWGRGRVPTPTSTHPQLGVQWGQGDPGGDGGGGAQGNGREWGHCFPCPLRYREECWAPRPNPLPLEPPSCCAEPKPHPYTPTQSPTSTLGDPFNELGHTHSLRALPPNCGMPHSRHPPFEMLPLPFHAGPKQRLCPRLECHPTWASPPGPFPTTWVLSLGPTQSSNVTPHTCLGPVPP